MEEEKFRIFRETRISGFKKNIFLIKFHSLRNIKIILNKLFNCLILVVEMDRRSGLL